MSITRAEINVDALASNLERVRQFAPDAKVMAVVKGDAYGHGLTTAVSALGAADAFGVATVDEATALRKLGYAGRIAVMSRIHNIAQMRRAMAARLWPVVHSDEQIAWLQQITTEKGYSGSKSVWLKVDTGMHRLGFTPEQVAARLESLETLGLSVNLLTHLANADEPARDTTRAQLAVFDALMSDSPVRRSAANSAGIVAFPAGHYDWVRPGIMLYGCSPVAGQSARSLGLEPVMTLRSVLLSVRDLKAGEPVGYAATWRSARDTRVGVVACGYADGYPRSAPSGTSVLVNDVPVSLAGRVSMDSLVVDLGPHSQAGVGDSVVLWGQGLPVEDVASASGTIAYELLCRVSLRVPRISV